MHNYNKKYQLFLSKNFEYFNSFNEINFNKDGLIKSNYNTPGTMFLTIFNNLDFILKTLQKSICYSDKQIACVTEFIVEQIYSISPFLSNVITFEIERYYYSLSEQREEIRLKLNTINMEITELNQILENDYLYNKYFEQKINEQEYYIDSISGDNFPRDAYVESEIKLLEELIDCQQSTSYGNVYIEQKINKLNSELEDIRKKDLTMYQIHDLISEYISGLIDSLIKFQYYFNMYFGISEEHDLKKKDIAYFQTIFNIKFDVPNHTIFACTEDKKSINPLSSNLSEKRIIECLDILKDKKQIVYLKEYEICTLNDILGIYFYFFTQENIWIKKCANCGKYFIPSIRCDSKYCDNVSPQNPNKTCKDIAADLFYKHRIASDPILNENSKTRGTLSKRISRFNQKNDIKNMQKAKDKFDKYKENYDKQLKKYESQKLSESEFIEWIIAQKQ